MVESIEPGLYTNLFEINIPERVEMELFVKNNATSQDKKDIEDTFPTIKEENKIYFSARNKNIYYYGSFFQDLTTKKGFVPQKVRIDIEPEFMCRIISDSILKASSQFNLVPVSNSMELKLMEKDRYGSLSSGINIFKGYVLDIRFSKKEGLEGFSYTVSIDTIYFTKDSSNKSISTRDIAENYGENALRDIKVIQKEYIIINGQYKINSEISRQRMVEDIIPLVTRIKEFHLISGGKAVLSGSPVRIIIGGEYGALW